MRLASLMPITLLALVLDPTAPCQSQQRSDRRPDKVPAKEFRVHGGLVNFAEGDVQCVCGGGPAKRLQARQVVGDGDTVQVGDEGRVEILLEPGYYLRLFNRTQARLVNLSPGNLKIK